MAYIHGAVPREAYAGAYQKSAGMGAESHVDSKGKSTRTDRSEQTGGTKKPQLSQKAQALLEKLKKTYGNMDFMVADFDSGDDAKEILSRGTKEFSVLFSSEELEKMASSEKYEKEYMDRVQGAVRMSEQINQQYGFTSAFGEEGSNGKLTKIGIAFHKDGTVTYFAELEKSSEKQREWLEKWKEKRTAEKQAAEKHTVEKKATVQASTQEALLAKIQEIDWSKVKEETGENGSRFDAQA